MLTVVHRSDYVQDCGVGYVNSIPCMVRWSGGRAEVGSIGAGLVVNYGELRVWDHADGIWRSTSFERFPVIPEGQKCTWRSESDFLISNNNGYYRYVFYTRKSGNGILTALRASDCCALFSLQKPEGERYTTMLCTKNMTMEDVSCGIEKSLPLSFWLTDKSGGFTYMKRAFNSLLITHSLCLSGREKSGSKT